MTCRQTVSLGAYLLGALDPAERSAFEEHLAGCKTCKAELLRLAPLPGLLQRLTPEDYAELEAGDVPDFPPVDLMPLLVPGFDPAGLDPAVLDGPAPDEKTPDEKTPDEKTPDEKTPDGAAAGPAAEPLPVADDRQARAGEAGEAGEAVPVAQFRPVAELPPVTDGPAGAVEDPLTTPVGEFQPPVLSAVPTAGSAAAEPAGEEVTRGRSGWWRRQGLAVAAAAAIILLALGGLFVFQSADGPAETTAITPVTWSAVDPSTGVRGRVELVSQGWGTEVKVSMQDVPTGRKICHLLVYGRDGTRETAGKWTAGYYREVRAIPGSSSIKLGDIDRIEVVAAGGVLVSMHSP